MQNKKIGILGGMGPEASLNLYKQIIKISQEKYNAVQDKDYPEIILFSMALNEFDETGIINKAKVLEQLSNGIETLEKGGSDLIIIACNTVHLLIDELQAKTNVPIINLIEETAKNISDVEKAILFASETTIKSKLYSKALDKNNISYIIPEENIQKTLTKVILKVMGGGKNFENEINVLKKYVKEKGVDSVILGCTELPLALNKNNLQLKTFDSSEIIANLLLENVH